MRIFIGGATGTIGRRITRRLVEAGHEVHGLTRSDASARALSTIGAEPVVGDVFDVGQLISQVAAARPDVVVEQLTALPAEYTARAMRHSLPTTNRVRTQGGRNLQEAARRAGARRYIAQSGCYYYAPGDTPAAENTPFATTGPPLVTGGAAALAELERRVLASPAMDSVVLRYGFFYGPDTWYAANGAVAQQVRDGRSPVIGDGRGVWPFVHIDDAADVTVTAVTSDLTGVFNIADRDHLALAEWLPAYAQWLAAPAPPHLAADAADEDARYYATQLRAADSSRARDLLGFAPRTREWTAGGIDIRIRPEEPRDHDAVHEVITAAFGQPDEADLVRRLRNTGDYVPRLAFVAELDGTIIGHIAYSRVTTEPAGDTGLSLAPVSVVPAWQGRGIGSRLIRHSLEAARRHEERWVILLGHPEYYPRFGFRPASEHGVRAPWHVPPEAWMLRILDGGTPPGPGTVRYSPAFETNEPDPRSQP